MSSRPSSPPASERTPLLSNHDASSDPPSIHGNGNGTIADPVETRYPDAPLQDKRRSRWPSAIALGALCLLVVIACFGFAIPSVAQEYATKALVFEPDTLSIDSITSFGVRARIQGDVWLDASRVQRKTVRDLGRFATWVAREVESGESRVQVYLPGYNGVLIGTATVPPVKVGVRNKWYNHLDVLADLEPGDVSGIRAVADDFLAGRLKDLDVRAVARVPLRSGILGLGTQRIEKMMRLQGGDVPSMPGFGVEALRFAEHGPAGHPDGVKAMASVMVQNRYPVNFALPPLGFDVLLPDCHDDYLLLATAKTHTIHVAPKRPINASVTGLIRQLPTSLTSACPGSNNSPLDTLVGKYLSGKDATVYIRGGRQDPDTPEWLARILRDTTLPFSLPGHPFDNLVKNFSLADTHFSLPDPISNDPHPKISAVVKVLVGLPAEMNVNLDVDRVRAIADVFYKGDKMGKLDLSKWQEANATQVDEDLLIQSVVDEAPLEITDDAVFSKVVREIAFGGDGVHLGVKANVDAGTVTALGKFVVRNIPATGKIFIKPLGRKGFSTPHISNLAVVATTSKSLTLQVSANVTNPTEYSAHVPYANVSILVNDTRIGYAWLPSPVDVVPGPNSDLTVRASFETGPVGREFLSQFISGYNTSFTVATHEGSVTGLPDLGVNITMPAPHGLFGKFLREATMHIISSTATFTLSNPLSSKPLALSFPLDFNQPQSSLKTPILTITSISAHAYHNKSSSNALNIPDLNVFTPSDSDSDFNPTDSNPDPYNPDSEFSKTTPEDDNDDDDLSEIGTISYSTPFTVPPGISESPRLPVKWSLDGLGTVREALGGRLKLDARAVVGVRISFSESGGGGDLAGRFDVERGAEDVEWQRRGAGDGGGNEGEDDGAWEETIWFHGKGIGAHVRL